MNRPLPQFNWDDPQSYPDVPKPNSVQYVKARESMINDDTCAELLEFWITPLR